MRRHTKILLLITTLVILAIWSPWQNWDIHWLNLFGIDSKENLSSLKVKSFSGELEVYLDDQLVGVAKDDEGFLEVFPVVPGEHTVKLSRPDNDGFYVDFERKLNFEKEVDVVIGYDLGPSMLFSEGHLLTSRKNFTKGMDPQLDVISLSGDIDVKINGRDVGKTPLQSIPMTTDTTHVLNFSRQGYDPLEIEIFPTEKSEREKLKDITLTLEINLFAKPVELLI